MKRFPLALTIALVALAALAPGAPASITVTSNGDATVDDAACNLREAIEVANADTDANGCIGAAAGPDTLVFDSGVRNTTILTTGEPIVTDELTIDAGCPSAPTPCVGLNVSPSADALTTDATTPLTVRGLAITNAQTGILSQGGAVTVQGNWFGIMLNQTVAKNLVGVEGRDDAFIGGNLPAERNVFAANNDGSGNGAGVLLFGADAPQVYGNYFGVNPSGALAAGMQNDDNIRITDNGGDDATGVTIGGTDDGNATVCDDDCNLIANALNTGININGATGSVEVQGNHIGLSPNGNSWFPNGGGGVSNNGADLQLGGISPLDRNYIAGHETAVFSDSTPGTTLFASQNFIGTNSAGTARLPANPTDTSRSLVSSSGTAQIEDNVIGGSFAVVDGNNSVVQGNKFGVGTGGQNIGMESYAVFIGGNFVDFGGGDPGEGNVVGFQTGPQFGAVGIIGGMSGALDAAVMGNFIGTDAGGGSYPNEGAGIEVGVNGEATSGHVIGGCPACANVISNSGTDAIRIESDGSDENFVSHNTGRNNGRLDVHGPTNDLFLDLGANGQGNGANGPNEGIEAPGIGTTGLSASAATTSSLSGTSSEPDGTDIFVYTTYTRYADIKSFVAEGTVSGGAWSVTYPSALPAGTCITANQIDPNNNSSELAPPVAVSGVGGVCDRIAPRTRITRKRKRVTPHRGGVLKIRFKSNEKGVTFQCSRQRGKFRRCRSPKTFKRLVYGKCSRVRVRAVDEAGNRDKTPAKVRFCVPPEQD